jgi:hypothetical protein
MSESESELLYDWRFTANQFVWVTSPLRLTTIIVFPTEHLRSVPVQHPLWRKDGSVVYNYCWLSLAQSFSGPSPAGLMITFYCHRLETPPIGGSGHLIYIPQEQGGPVIPSGIGFPFRRLLLLAGLRWRYSTPPPHGSTALLLYAAKHFFIITLHGPHGKRRLLLSRIVLGVFTAPLHSNGRGRTT